MSFAASLKRLSSQQAGLVCGKELYFAASTASVKPRFAVEAHLNKLFVPEVEQPTGETEKAVSHEEAATNESVEQEKMPVPVQLPTSLTQEEYEELSQHNAERHDWIEQLGAQDRGLCSNRPGTHVKADADYQYMSAAFA